MNATRYTTLFAFATMLKIQIKVLNMLYLFCSKLGFRALAVTLYFSFVLNPAIAMSEYEYLQLLVDSKQAIGARFAGSKQEQETADFIERHWLQMGYTVKSQQFAFKTQNANLRSENLMIDIPGQQDKWVVIAAHYDSTGEGSLGATDNGAGIAVLLALANRLRDHKSFPYSIRLLALGAEEVGLQGAKHYVSKLTQTEIDSIIAMVNLDTIAGGDNLYVHSAHTKPYKCDDGQEDYTSSPAVRDALQTLSQTLFEDQAHKLHPAYPGYPKGVTGGWSDHAPFACAGVPIAYIETTNFSINGKDGYDGYSQSTHPKLWDCFDEKTNTACDRDAEKKWGNIWHTDNDRLSLLNELFPGRVSKQMRMNTELLERLVLDADKWLNFKKGSE
ncbi:MAG: M20/M25/M40 family metallo-hydrolase [Aliiglaciecola sp.]